MKSHEYQFSSKDLAGIMVLPVTMLFLFSAIMHVGAKINLLPRPRPSGNVEEAVVVHQIDAARKSTAEIVLVGDSSCLMNVDAQLLSKTLGKPTLNLGTFTFLSLREYGDLLEECRTPPRMIVLLLHPDSLGKPWADPYYAGLFRSYREGKDFAPDLLGVSIFRNRVAGKILPSAFRGSFGAEYGFSHLLEKRMTEQNGSLLDPVEEKVRKSESWFAAPEFPEALATFRSRIGDNTLLTVGISPVAKPDGDLNEMLNSIKEPLGNVLLLTNLPAVLPERSFGRRAHLNESARRSYTLKLADELRPLLSD